MNKISGIYTITNIINNKIYVGCSIDISKRLKMHKNQLLNNKHHSIHLQAAWNKYGEKNFLFEILEECNKKYLYSQEHYWVTILNTLDIIYGYNIKITHPENKSVMSNELKEKLRKISSERSKGEKNYFFSKKGELSSMFGKCGDKHHNFGKKQSETWIRNAANSRKVKIIQMSLDYVFIKEWNSIKEASEELKICKTSINLCCQNKRKTAGNFKWKYKT